MDDREQQPTQDAGRAIDHRLMLATGWEYLPNTSFNYQRTPRSRTINDCHVVPLAFTRDESVFADHVIPALDARGLGRKYVRKLTWMLEERGVDFISLDWADQSWEIHKAPLALRARAALTVLENAKP